jgi:sigma-B regulation protein RsbU (phosphoserine phosphatase)
MSLPDQPGTGDSDDFVDFFDNSLNGYAIATTEGIITRVNKTLARWTGSEPGALKGKPFTDLLALGGKIYYETHLSPLLKMQGFFDEIAVEITDKDQQKMAVLLNALESRNEKKATASIRYTVTRATDRRIYEQNLKQANASLQASLADAKQISQLREQLIAILGHDLRNPLGSIMAGVGLLSESALTEDDANIVQIINRSATRMAELIGNIMDFARTRMGEGIILNPRPMLMEPILKQVADELKTAWPARHIEVDLQLPNRIYCDAPRIAQILSNLLANALTHGSEKEPVTVKAGMANGSFSITVCNGGDPIPAHLLGEKLFEPFTREGTRPSRNGLGLGLYIASHIAKAHKGSITATSDEKLTCFTFHMPI